ncbi:MAG: thymidine phosphorylase, partial [Candidatus Dormibacteraceae bacterium]
MAAAVQGSVPDYQLAAWLMAVTCRGMTRQETLILTEAMVQSGETLALPSLGQLAVDKHSTGGVGDKVTLIACPLAAALGVRVPKLSGRGLAHTGGTLDKLESLPGVTVELPPDRFLRQVEEVGLAVAAQSERMVPADRVLYQLRDVTGTVPSIPLIASSVMSKKLAAGAAGIVLDVKFGRGAFLPTLEGATRLAEEMVEIARASGRRATAMLTAMEAPLGSAVGNALEVREAVRVLEGGGDRELRELAIAVAVEMCTLAGILRDPEEAIASGAGLATFWAMVEAQGGRAGGLPDVAPEVLTVTSPGDGWVRAVDALAVGTAVLDLGGGRRRKGDAIDHGVGVLVEAAPGQEVRRGDALCR